MGGNRRTTRASVSDQNRPVTTCPPGCSIVAQAVKLPGRDGPPVRDGGGRASIGSAGARAGASRPYGSDPKDRADGRERQVSLRQRLASALKGAPEPRTAATLRLVLAALKERDHCAREAGVAEELDDDAIEAMLRDMVAQREVDIARCEEAARLEDAEQEAAEIEVLQQFLPQRMADDEVDAAVDEMIGEVGASRLKDTGRVIAALKERYYGEMDFARAKRRVCQKLD
jgi:uncharacterized protein